MIHEFDPVIYPFTIWILVDRTPKEIEEKFLCYEDSEEIKFEQKFISLTDACANKVIDKTTYKYGCYIYFKSKSEMTVKTIAHESVHAAKFMFEHINASIDPHEPFEYLVGFIADCCYKAKKYKQK
jgi:hypothetical protein